MCKHSIFFIISSKLEFSLVLFLFCTEGCYRRVLYSVMCDVIVLKLTTEPLQAPGDISTGVDEVRRNLSPLRLLFIYCPTRAMPPNAFNHKWPLLHRSHQIWPAFKSSPKDFWNGDKTKGFKINIKHLKHTVWHHTTAVLSSVFLSLASRLTTLKPHC